MLVSRGSMRFSRRFKRFQEVPRGAFEQRFRAVSKGFKRLVSEGPMKFSRGFRMFQEVRLNRGLERFQRDSLNAYDMHTTLYESTQRRM